MCLGMLTFAIARVVEHRRWRSRPAKRPVVPDIQQRPVSVLPLASTGTVVSSA
jgi:hypothetical protein